MTNLTSPYVSHQLSSIFNFVWIQPVMMIPSEENALEKMMVYYKRFFRMVDV